MVCFLDSWIVHATIDPKFCNATVDFDVPGKPNPPPVSLTATIWTELHYMPKGSVEKNAIEFTDPSGKLASPSVPLNTWVQLDDLVTENDPSAAPTSCIQGSPLVFKDEHDGDSKRVTLSGNELTITSFQTSEGLSTLIPIFHHPFSSFVSSLLF